jgi:hypothetical protein
MRFSTTQHPFYCGSDLHARRMSVCILHQDGALLLHRHLQARPETFLQAIAPSREALVVAGDGLFTWYGLADRWAPAGLPLVLGHALSMPALQGGQATPDQLDAHQMAVGRRGGLRPQAAVEPAALRATRDRRRRARTRQRAARRAPSPHTHRPSHRPELGTKRASHAHRDGVAERFPAPAGPQSRAGDRARLGAAAPRRRARGASRQSGAAARRPPLSRRQTGPGSGLMRRLVRREALPARPRCPRGPAGVASGRLGTGAKDAAGTRNGPAGTTRGQASRPWACAAAAGLVLRAHPAGHPSRTRWAKTPGQGHALPRLAPQRGRAVSAR